MADFTTGDQVRVVRGVGAGQTVTVQAIVTLPMGDGIVVTLAGNEYAVLNPADLVHATVQTRYPQALVDRLALVRDEWGKRGDVRRVTESGAVSFDGDIIAILDAIREYYSESGQGVALYDILQEVSGSKAGDNLSPYAERIRALVERDTELQVERLRQIAWAAYDLVHNGGVRDQFMAPDAFLSTLLDGLDDGDFGPRHPRDVQENDDPAGVVETLKYRFVNQRRVAHPLNHPGESEPETT